MRSGIIIMIFTILLYFVLFLLFPDKTEIALFKSIHLFEKLLLVLGVIFIFMVINNMFITKEKIQKYFSNSLKGYFISIFASFIAMGPTYAWYPLLENLKEKGIRESLLIVFLFARSIKIVWLPMMILFFGLKYTILFVLVVSIFSILQGFIYRWFFEK